MKNIYRNYVHKDFSYLLASNDETVAVKEILDGGRTVEYYIPHEKQSAKNTNNADVEREVLKRNKSNKTASYVDKMSNPSYKYAFSRLSEEYHDKSCSLVRSIPQYELDYTMLYSDSYNWCPRCYKTALIRYGVGGDVKLLDRYVDFFKSVKASKELLHFLIIEKQAKLWIVSTETMQIKVNDDTWRVTKKGDKYTLMHNNYYINESGKRVIQKTFHLQAKNINSFKTCVNIISSYSWNKHIEKQTEKQALIEKANKRRLLIFELSNDCFVENFMYVKNKYLFSEKFVYLDNRDYDADIFLEKNNIKINFLDEYIMTNGNYRWIVCKVPKRYLTGFYSAMRQISGFMLKKHDYEYFEALREFIEIK
ncbi:MAG: hypothetical protein ACI4XC_05940 [Eubacterium sp.]